MIVNFIVNYFLELNLVIKIDPNISQPLNSNMGYLKLFGVFIGLLINAQRKISSTIIVFL